MVEAWRRQANYGSRVNNASRRKRARPRMGVGENGGRLWRALGAWHGVSGGANRAAWRIANGALRGFTLHAFIFFFFTVFYLTCAPLFELAWKHHVRGKAAVASA